MARYTGPVCRLCRRDGTKLFLKGPKCFSDKCPVEKRNFPPGLHGQSKKVKKVVGYGLQQVVRKQKAKRIYFTLGDAVRAYYEETANKTGVTGELLLQQLETRLGQRLLARLGFALSRRQSRQVVRHGHVQVNGRKVDIPSFQCKVGDEDRDPREVRRNLYYSPRRRTLFRARPACSGLKSPATICRARSLPCRSAKTSACRSTSS